MMNTAPNGLDLIIPCYNAEATLERAVASALRQAEIARIWLVDDGSTDGTADLIRRLHARYPRIIGQTMPENGGAARARNWAALQSSADIIAFLDADDAYEDGALAAPLAVLQRYPEMALVRLKMRPTGLPEHYRLAEGFARAWQSLEMTGAGNTVFRRSAFLAAGGFPQHELFRNTAEKMPLWASPLPVAAWWRLCSRRKCRAWFMICTRMPMLGNCSMRPYSAKLQTASVLPKGSRPKRSRSRLSGASDRCNTFFQYRKPAFAR